MATPEGKIKAKVTAALKKAFEEKTVYYLMPVQAGMGPATLDYIACCKGHFFAIETKAPGKKPTPRQVACKLFIERAGGTVFIIDNADQVPALKQWIETRQWR